MVVPASSALSLDSAVQKRIEEAAEAWAAPFLRIRGNGRQSRRPWSPSDARVASPTIE